MPSERNDTLATLQWLIDAGADEAIGETPVDRLAALGARRAEPPPAEKASPGPASGPAPRPAAKPAPRPAATPIIYEADFCLNSLM